MVTILISAAFRGRRLLEEIRYMVFTRHSAGKIWPSKMKSKYSKRGIVSCKRMWKLVWPNIKNSYSEMFRKKAFLKFLGKHEWRRSLLSRYTVYSLDIEVGLHHIYFPVNFFKLVTTPIPPVGQL